MKLIDNILYIEYSELVQAGVSDNTIKYAKSQNSKSWTFIQDPADARKVLIAYDKLRQNYKDLVCAQFGDPYVYIARQPIRNMVSYDAAAEKFYLEYRYNTNKSLSESHVRRYALAASWLNMLQTAMADKRELKKLLNLDIVQFWIEVCAIIKETQVNRDKAPLDYVDLPTSSRRLMARLKEYSDQGYKVLINPQFGNNYAAKVCDEISGSLLLEMICQHNQHDDVFIAQAYNAWAAKNNYKEIDKTTVGVWRRNNEHLITAERNGNEALNEKFLKQVKGFRPSFPLAFVESDDNHIDLLFMDPDDTSSSKYYHKYKAIVVMDSYNDYVLGYAYAENLSIELVKAAYLNAMYHIRSLTGAWYVPHETKTDKWAGATLIPFYKSFSTYVDSQLGNKHRGYIEQFFGSPLWKRCLKAGANNYSGNNITAKNRGVNTEILKASEKVRPAIGEQSIAQIETFFHNLRTIKGPNGKSKQEAWLEAWNSMPADKKKEINDVQFLLKFGIEHNHLGKGIQISNRGVEPAINGVKYSYDLEQYDLEHIGKSVSIFYDPHDMSRVLLTDFDHVRIIARDARLQARALQDADVNSRTMLNQIFQQKKDAVAQISDKSKRRKEVLKENRVSIDQVLAAEAMLQSGLHNKEVMQQANENIMLPPSSNDYNVFDHI